MSKECDILLYALSTCIHCRKTKEFLEDNDITFECVLVDKLSGEMRKDTLATIKSHNPKLSFPTLVIGGGAAVVVGFRKNEIEEALDL